MTRNEIAQLVEAAEALLNVLPDDHTYGCPAVEGGACGYGCSLSAQRALVVALERARAHDAKGGV